MGGRVDYVGERRVAVLVYRHAQHWIDVFVLPGGGSGYRGSEALARQGFNLVHRQFAGVEIWAVSDLEADELAALGPDPVMFDLLRWHGAEEVEHRSVAFDLFQHLTPRHRYLWRVHGLVFPFPVMGYLGWGGGGCPSCSWLLGPGGRGGSR